MKIVINACHGGFSLSRDAVLLGRNMSGNDKWGGPCIKGDIGEYGRMLNSHFGFINVGRDDEILVAVVKQLGKDANGERAKLVVVNVPNGTDWEIHENDGNEWVAERHQTWM